MHIGFTGTSSHDLTRNQREYTRVELIINAAPLGETNYLHLGDCIHADAECHEIAVAQQDLLGGRMFVTVGHIPNDNKKRAFCKYEIELPPKPYIDRNHDIVDQSSVLLACPGTMEEQIAYSGTWATIRYALKKGKKVVIIWPEGEPVNGWEWYKLNGKLQSVVREGRKAIEGQYFRELREGPKLF